MKSHSLDSKWSSEESQSWTKQFVSKGGNDQDENSSKSKSPILFPDFEVDNVEIGIPANERIFSTSSECTGIQDFYPSEQISK